MTSDDIEKQVVETCRAANLLVNLALNHIVSGNKSSIQDAIYYAQENPFEFYQIVGSLAIDYRNRGVRLGIIIE